MGFVVSLGKSGILMSWFTCTHRICCPRDFYSLLGTSAYSKGYEKKCSKLSFFLNTKAQDVGEHMSVPSCECRTNEQSSLDQCSNKANVPDWLPSLLGIMFYVNHVHRLQAKPVLTPGRLYLWI